MDMKAWEEMLKVGSPFAILLIGFLGKRNEARRDKERSIDEGLLEHKMRLEEHERRLGELEKKTFYDAPHGS